MKRIILIAFFLAFLPVSADCSIDGNKLLSYIAQTEGDMDCETSLMTGTGFGYVLGVKDSYNGIAFSVEKEVKPSQLFKVVEKYLKNHPEELHDSAIDLIVKALGKAFPEEAKRE